MKAQTFESYEDYDATIADEEPTPPKLTGGIAGFKKAVNEAYFGRGQQMHSPSIKYSDSRGFFVESALTPSDSDVLWTQQANYHASNGARTIESYGTVANDIGGAR